jgi:hypothetical protein
VVTILDVPDRRELARFTEQVHRNNRSLPPEGDEAQNGHDDDHDHGHDADDRRGRDHDDRHDDHGRRPDPIPTHLGQRSPIKHVFYIIKENRTYDQVFGDMAQGNGDRLRWSSHGRSANHHALAEQFRALDNYRSGGPAGLGHAGPAGVSQHVGAQRGTRRNQSRCVRVRPTPSTTTQKPAG